MIPVKSNIHPHPYAISLTGKAVLDVVTMVSNPVRYDSRYKLLDHFRKQNDPFPKDDFNDARLWTVEVAYGNRPFVITESNNPFHIQLRTEHEIWHKENALNVAFSHICQVQPDTEYLAWVDSDITFSRSDWAYETLQQLQHYDVVQMFSHSQDVGPKYEPIGNIKNGWVWMYYNDPDKSKLISKIKNSMNTADGYYGYTKGGYWHPGFCWAAKRSAIDKLGGLIDIGIVGSGDWHMAAALIGEAEKTLSRNLHKNYKTYILNWQDRAERYIKRNIGYVHGIINHHWHGRKVDRQYSDRWKILVENNYDPLIDLRRDSQNLYALNDRNIKLRDDIRSYMRSRNEDSIDIAV